jgi:hypothetical protein
MKHTSRGWSTMWLPQQVRRAQWGQSLLDLHEDHRFWLKEPVKTLDDMSAEEIEAIERTYDAKVWPFWRRELRRRRLERQRIRAAALLEDGPEQSRGEESSSPSSS